ncbi:uncharacterized protein LOC136030449 isoform X2 [Artemia franciscana]|uniref:Uncharacterized protein n=1 Tax=Artemia franciscana TaxID=6661 RepID=A0AA88L302_ARTSF|nr:hypothetical protein QYM36_016073 [Artemia franciscana]
MIIKIKDMILDPIEQHVFQKAKYSTIPYIDDSETESESTSKDDALDDILSINDEEVEEFDRFFLLSSPEDDAKSFQEDEEIRSFFESGKKPLKRAVSLDSVSRKHGCRTLAEKRKRNLTDLCVDSKKCGVRSNCVSPSIAEGIIAEKIALLMKSGLRNNSGTKKHNKKGDRSCHVDNKENNVSDAEKVNSDQKFSSPLKDSDVTLEEKSEDPRRKLTNLIAYSSNFSSEIFPAKNTSQRVSQGAEEDDQNERKQKGDPEAIVNPRITSLPDQINPDDLKIIPNPSLANEHDFDTHHFDMELAENKQNSDENWTAPLISYGDSTSPSKDSVENFDCNSIDEMPITLNGTSQCLNANDQLLTKNYRDLNKLEEEFSHEIEPKFDFVKKEETPLPLDIEKERRSPAVDVDTYPHLAVGKVSSAVKNELRTLPNSSTVTKSEFSSEIVLVRETEGRFDSACERILTEKNILEAGRILADINETSKENSSGLYSLSCDMPKSALKHTGSVNKKARVIFNESKNVYFDANYVIYVDYDEDEYEIDLIDEQERPKFVSVKEFELNEVVGCESQPATLSPPDGYKDGLGLETGASMIEYPVTTVPETSDTDSSDRSDVEDLETSIEGVLQPIRHNPVMPDTPSLVTMTTEDQHEADCDFSVSLEMEPPRGILKGGKNWRENNTREKSVPGVRFNNCEEKCDKSEEKVDPRQNSAFQQLFPHAAKKLVHNQSDTNAAMTIASISDLDAFKRYEDWRHFMNTRPLKEKEMIESSTRLRQSIEKNSLRRSMVKRNIELKENCISESTDNLTEKLRWLTCIDENEDQENGYVRMSDVVPEIKLEMEQVLQQQQHQVQKQEEEHQCRHQTVPNKEPGKPNEDKKKNEKIYKKFNDFFRLKKEKDDKNQKSKTRRSVSPPPPSEVEPGFMRKKKEQMPDILAQSVLNPLTNQKRTDLIMLRVPDDLNSGDSGSSGAESYSIDDIEEVLGGTGCTVHHARYVPGEESRDDSGGSRSSRSSGDSGVGVQDSSIDTTDGQPRPGEEELALFIQRDAGRLDRLKKRYSITEEEDEMEDYGFLRRPSVRGIKPKFGTTTEIIKQMQEHLQPPAIATRGASHTTWPYPEKSDKRKGIVHSLQPLLEERPMNQSMRFIRPAQPPRLQRLASSPNLLARPDSYPIETLSNIKWATQSVIPPHNHPRPELVIQRHPNYLPGSRPTSLAPSHTHPTHGLRSPLQLMPEHFSTLPHPLTSSYHEGIQRLPSPHYRGVDDSIIYTTDGRFRPYQKQVHAYYKPECSDCGVSTPGSEDKVMSMGPKGEREGPEGASSSPGLASDVVPNALDYSKKDAAAIIPASLALVRP